MMIVIMLFTLIPGVLIYRLLNGNWNIFSDKKSLLEYGVITFFLTIVTGNAFLVIALRDLAQIGYVGRYLLTLSVLTIGILMGYGIRNAKIPLVRRHTFRWERDEKYLELDEIRYPLTEVSQWELFGDEKFSVLYIRNVKEMSDVMEKFDRQADIVLLENGEMSVKMLDHIITHVRPKHIIAELEENIDVNAKEYSAVCLHPAFENTTEILAKEGIF